MVNTPNHQQYWCNKKVKGQSWKGHVCSQCNHQSWVPTTTWECQYNQRSLGHLWNDFYKEEWREITKAWKWAFVDISTEYDNQSILLKGRIFIWWNIKLDSKNALTKTRMRRIIIHGLRTEYRGIITAKRRWAIEPTLSELKNMLAKEED